MEEKEFQSNLNILIVENRKENICFLSSKIKEHFNAQLGLVSTVDEAKHAIKENSFDLVIARSFIGNVDICSKILVDLENLKYQDKTIPLIILGKTTATSSMVKTLPEPFVINDLVELMNEELKVKSINSDEYHVVPLHIIPPGLKLIGQIFKKEQESFIPLLGKNGIIHKEVIEVLQKSNVENIYISSSDRELFFESLNAHTVKELKNEELTINERICNSSMAQKLAFDRIRDVGVSKEIVELCNTCIDSMNSIVEEIPSLDKLLKTIKEEDLLFHYQHCLLNIYFSAYFLNKLKWKNAGQLDKLSFVSFFHDIHVPQERMCKINTANDLLASDLTESEAKIVNGHALNAARVIGHFNKIPLGADIIIKQHHGREDGIGFSTTQSEISPLARVFMVAEDCALYVLGSYSKDMDARKPMNYLRKRYEAQIFEEIIPYLEELSW